MDYEKKYKEALERMRYVVIEPKNENMLQAIKETVFPELKESEDERIRKELIEHVKDQQSSFISAPDCRDKYEEEENNKYNSWLAWLEKQGGQNPQRMISAEAKEAMYDKPADKIEPKFKVGDKVIGIVSDMQYYITDVCYDHYYTESGCIIMFCSQDNFKLVEQKPACSEEDERNFNDTILFIETGTYSLDKDNLINWLKSFKDKYTWKPSIAQLNALSIVSKGNAPDDIEAIVSLYNDLKKLRGE